MATGKTGRAFEWLRRPPKGLEGAAFWLAVQFFLLGLFRLGNSEWNGLFAVLQVLAAAGFFGVGIPLVLRFVRRRLLWSLRSRLVLTYLLFGLTPVVLGVMLVGVFGYFAAGQFAIHLVDTRLLTERDRLRGQTGNRFGRLLQAAGMQPAGVNSQQLVSLLPTEREGGSGLDMARTTLHQQSRLFLDGVPVEVSQSSADASSVRTPLGLPVWASTLPDGRFAGLVLDGNELYLVAINQERLTDNRVLSLLTSVEVDEHLMEVVAEGLGRAELFAVSTVPQPTVGEGQTNEGQTGGGQGTKPAPSRRRPDSVAGGSAPARVNLADMQVRFLSTLGLTNWDTGLPDSIPIRVDSRPSLLYRQLFGGSLAGVITSAYRIALGVLIVVFGLLEALALYLAVRLGRTITASVADLYAATQSIDRGDFRHRIKVKGVDQLSELGRSFNTMTGSLERLLVEQKEKERLQNELSIAQEVQANLFPQADCNLANL